MKHLLYFIIIALSLSLSSCSECDGENPSVALLNNGSAKADIQIKTTGGNTVNINNVLVGSMSEKKFFSEGDIQFTINIQGKNDPVIYDLKVYTCKDYIVKINSDDTVSSTGGERE